MGKLQFLQNGETSMELKNTEITGTAWVYGNNIDTDQIFPGKYLAILDPKEMALHAMEGVPDNPEAFKQMKEGDILVAGKNFGNGSSREHAPLALMRRGIRCVIAQSFARIFYRNAVNIGLPLLELSTSSIIRQQDQLKINLKTGKVTNLTSGDHIELTPLKGLELKIISAGGLIPYIKSQ
jgi:3-isopropylmalate/(R)-2-methylmalate dehydratase small subunit